MNDNEIPERVCVQCGRLLCERQTFLDSKPLWVGDDGETYERISKACDLAAEDLGERYAVLWSLAVQKVYANELYMGEHAATIALAEFLRDAVRYPHD